MMPSPEAVSVIPDLLEIFGAFIIGMGIVGFTFKKVMQWTAKAFS